MTDSMNKQVLLAARPVGAIKDSDFQVTESAIPKPGDGQVLVKTLYLSLDPAMRGWMNDTDSYIEPVQLGDVMRGSTIGEVIESNDPAFAVGDNVFGSNGWQQYCVVDPATLTKLPSEVPLPLTNFLSVLGVTGLTAYFGLLEVGDPKAGETVVVSTAAGAVGSIVGQIAKIKGCRVVGIAGSDEKCAWCVDDLGFDACINYKKQDVEAELKNACPDGVDVYFDNVGGDVLNIVLGMNNFGSRIILCGAITQYNATAPVPGPANYIRLLTKSSRMEGFIVLNYLDRFQEGVMQMAQWVLEGKIKHREDVVEGLENAPHAIHKLFDGTNKGKLIIKVA